MRSQFVGLVFSAVVACACAANYAAPSISDLNLPMTPVAGEVATLRFVGNVNGERAEAVVSFERLRDYILVAGSIQSRSAKYGFRADVYGDSGFGTIVDLGDGTRWQIKVQLFAKGFALISNPLGPGSPTTYYFKVVQSQ